MATFLHTHQTLRAVADRYEQDELLQAAIKETEVCQNWREETGTECVQPGPLCKNFECGMCQSCEQAGYLCPNASEHDFGGGR